MSLYKPATTTTTAAVRKVLVGGIRPYSSTASASFESLYNTLDERLARERLNTTNRNLAYRPRRAGELRSRKEPILVEGKPLEPRVWPGLPRKADLTKCINQMAGREDFNKLKYLIKDYVHYHPDRFDQNHLVTLLRKAATVGLFPEALSFVNSSTLRPLAAGAPYFTELARIYSIRLDNLVLENVEQVGITRYMEKFAKIFKQADSAVPGFSSTLDPALIKLKGLTSLTHYGIQDESLKSEIKAQEDVVANILKSTSAEEQLALRSKQQLPAFCIDLARASEVLDNAHLNTLRDAVVAKFKNTAFVESYIETLRSGMANEIQQIKPGQEEEEDDI